MTPENFQKEYNKLFLPLCLYALRITLITAEAEDAVQKAFEEAWLHVDDILVLKPYIYRAVRNEALAIMRQSQRFDTVDEAYSGDVTEELIDTSERDARLWKAIDELPPRCREVFLMSKRDGMSHGEIAQELGVSEKTIENQITKAYSKLRQHGEILNSLSLWFLPFI